MRRLRRFVGMAAFAFLLSLTAPVFGQNWQVPNHYVPIGRGAGVTGFGSAAPVAGALFQATTTSANPAFTITPTLGVAGTSKGTLSLTGNTSGTVLLTPQATAGSPTLTFPNASGTFAISASSPVVLSATTGNLTCATCVTSSGGGAITGTAPVAVSAAGVVSITGAAGQVLAGASPAFTATPTLGASGTLGTIAFGNATSGTITLSPVAGALGTVTLTMPAATDTLAVLAASQAFTNKTYNGNTWTAGTGTLTIAAAKTHTVNSSLTLAGTDGKTLTVSNSGTLSGGDAFILSIAAAKTLTASNTLTLAGTDGKSLTLTTGLTVTTNDGTLAFGAASKTLTVNKSLTLDGTDSTTMTFPSVSATITRTVASGAKALATGAVASAACTTAQTDTATGTLTTDAISATFNADPTAVTGYVPLTSGMLTIIAYPTADTVNFKVCNNTSSSITPGAITLNWRVLR